MKQYAITFESTTYRTYTVQAEDLETAEELAQDVLQDDLEVSSAWKENAEIESQRLGAVGFSTEDIMGMRPDLSEGQALEVIALTNRWFDASIGINWHVLEHNADHLFPEGKAWPED